MDVLDAVYQDNDRAAIILLFEAQFVIFFAVMRLMRAGDDNSVSCQEPLLGCHPVSEPIPMNSGTPPHHPTIPPPHHPTTHFVPTRLLLQP